jgi:hypothetical protein
MSEHRRHRRRNLDRDGKITYQGTGGSITIDCVVKDISDSGARLIVFTVSEIPAEFKLTVDGISDQDCLVKWSKWRTTGELAVEFVLPDTVSMAS